jgi:hypothetical protein
MPMLRRRRPVMRGAMVAGAGYAAGKSRANHQAQAAQAQQAAPPPPAPMEYEEVEAAPSMDQKVADLTQLKTLLDSGILTQEEFDAQKQAILAG